MLYVEATGLIELFVVQITLSRLFVGRKRGTLKSKVRINRLAYSSKAFLSFIYLFSES